MLTVSGLVVVFNNIKPRSGLALFSLVSSLFLKEPCAFVLDILILNIT